MKIKKHIAISDSGVVFNGSTGDSYSLNPIAGEILDILRKGASEDQIKVHILEQYEVDKDRIEGDLYDFFAHLRQLNIIEDEK